MDDVWTTDSRTFSIITGDGRAVLTWLHSSDAGYPVWEIKRNLELIARAPTMLRVLRGLYEDSLRGDLDLPWDTMMELNEVVGDLEDEGWQ